MYVHGIMADRSNIGWQAGRMGLSETKPEACGFVQQMKNTSAVLDNGQENRKTDDVLRAQEEENEEKKEADTRSKSDSEVVSKPDGTKILLIKTYVGGMETLTSIELSKPSPLAGEQEALSEDLMVRTADRSVSDAFEGEENGSDF